MRYVNIEKTKYMALILATPSFYIPSSSLDDNELFDSFELQQLNQANSLQQAYSCSRKAQIRNNQSSSLKSIDPNSHVAMLDILKQVPRHI